MTLGKCVSQHLKCSLIEEAVIAEK